MLDRLTQATDAHRQGRLQEADRLYREHLSGQPENFDALHQLGILQMQLGSLDEAQRLIERALAVNPRSGKAWSNLGSAQLGLRRHEQALASYDRAIALEPGELDFQLNRANVLLKLGRFAEALACLDRVAAPVGDPEIANRRAAALLGLGRLEEALASCEQALKLAPDFWEALANQGRALLELGRFEQAVASYDRVVALVPGHADAWNSRGRALAELGRAEEALVSLDKAVALVPKDAIVLNNRGNVLKGLKRYEEALASYDSALALKPDYAAAHNNRGNVLLSLERAEEALQSFDEAIALAPDHPDPHSNRGNALTALERFEEALASCERALVLKPDYAAAHNNRGNVLRELGRAGEALASYDTALAIDPANVDAHYNRGVVLFGLKRYAEAILAARQVLQLDPTHSPVLALCSLCGISICDWALTESLVPAVRTCIEGGVYEGECFPILSLFDDPLLQRKAAADHAAKKWKPKVLPAAPIRDSGRLRVGYLSADFGPHPVAFLTGALIEGHDRSSCDVVGFSAGPDSSDPWRIRMRKAFDRFIDVRDMHYDQLCQTIRAVGIDILVDLGGYTKDSRLLALAGRPAPIQISYIGFPGSTGAPFIDYMIADKFIIPEGSEDYYSEKIVYLPDCFQANDAQRVVGSVVPTRADCGLPDSGLIFCAFHNAYKIRPAGFDIWMGLLSAVPGSVLWLTAEHVARENLRREAQARGIDPDRLVFALPTNYPDHLARQKLADLFLDSWPYNAGTTASDALWVGLPVLTCSGRSYAARMAGSLLQAVGLPELITYTPEAYAALALRLATEPGLLAGIRQKLAANIKTAPLFDTDRFRRHIEAAYRIMWDRHLRGEPPASFTVQPIS